MNNYKQVEELVAKLKAQGLSKSEIIVQTARACMGWPYVWGGYGQYCSPANRKAYAERSVCPSGEADQIRKKCRVLNGKSDSCSGCKYYSSGRVRFFDCRGFTRWLMQQAGLALSGAGATSQWNDEKNWAVKGTIANLPQDKVCCLFMREGTKMSHTGMHIGNGILIHCSGEVKRGKVTDRGWTHYAIPMGLSGDGEKESAPQPAPEPVPAPVPEKRPVLRKGSSGASVVLLQELLGKRGYDLSPYGADGKFGAKTEAALKAFQKEHSDTDETPLKVDGIAGPATWRALDRADTEPGQKPAILFSVLVPHLTEDAADRLLQDYPDATKKEE